MESILDGITGALVGKSLDLTLMRHQVIANNIANANTQNYRPMRISFEDQLQSVVRRLEMGGDKDHLKKQLELVSAHPNIALDEESTKVVLDREVAKLAQNTINYQALLAAHSGLGSILSNVIKGGKQ